MRSRPKVLVLLTPPTANPGDEVVATTIVKGTTATPVSFVTIVFEGTVRVATGMGKSRRTHHNRFLAEGFRWDPRSLEAQEEKRFDNRFLVPREAPPTYHSADASISYAVAVHVGIPWWFDERRRFTLPVERAPAVPDDPHPRIYASSEEGPRGTDGFLELALDATRIPVGDIVSGSVSIDNVRGRRIRRLTVTFVETEHITKPISTSRVGRRFKLVAHEGQPPEGVAIPFRFRLPAIATVDLDLLAGQGALQIKSHVEARAEVAWGEDVVVRGAIAILPRAAAPRAATEVAALGRARRVLLWSEIAEAHGLLADLEGERIHGRSGKVTLEILAEYRASDFWLVAKLGWLDLGVDLAIAHARWTDKLARNVVKSGEREVDSRLVAHAREPEQVRALVAGDVLRPFLAFEEAKIVDDGARLALRGSPQDREALDRFTADALEAAAAIDRVLHEIPPPALFRDDRPAWESFAARLGGRLEVGRMWIRGGHVGPTAVEIGCSWERSGAHVGAEIGVAIDPPLGGDPPGPDDPAISPAAREAWRELTERASSVEVARARIAVRLEERLADPETAMPLLELAVALRRALAGTTSDGPFR